MLYIINTYKNIFLLTTLFSSVTVSQLEAR